VLKPATNSSRRRLKNILGGSAGNLVEWFDWYVYSAFALYFAHAFFPAGDPTAQLLNTAAIFAVGFVVRPIGAWLMGIYADHKGRKAGLTLSGSASAASMDRAQRISPKSRIASGADSGRASNM
jgi:MFS family permease